jgi:hypothetical protein
MTCNLPGNQYPTEYDTATFVCRHHNVCLVAASFKIDAYSKLGSHLAVVERDLTESVSDVPEPVIYVYLTPIWCFRGSCTSFHFRLKVNVKCA